MRQIRRHEHEVVCAVFAHAVADVALAAAVHRERQLVLGMVVPFEGNLRQAPVIDPNRTMLAEIHAFVGRFHV
jgi:hypothetical protein